MVELVDAPVSVGAVRVHGANNTTRAFLDWLIAPHLVVDPHSTFRDVLGTTTAISRALSATGLFRSHSVRIQPAENGSDAHVDLVYNVHERGRFFVKTSTELGDGEGNAASILSLSLSAHSPLLVARGPSHKSLWLCRCFLPQRILGHQDQTRVRRVIVLPRHTRHVLSRLLQPCRNRARTRRTGRWRKRGTHGPQGWSQKMRPRNPHPGKRDDRRACLEVYWLSQRRRWH